MALARQNKTAPAFEGEDQVDGAPAAEATQPEAPATAPAAEATQPEAPATATTQTAPAVAKPSGLAVKGGKMVNPYEGMKDAIDVETVKSFGPGAFPKITADLGGAVMDKEELGKSFVIALVSYNDRWLITPGSDDDEAKEFLKTSYDGTTIDDLNETAQEYVARLKSEEGFSKASIRRYVDLWGILQSTELKGVLPEDDQNMVHIQLSPQSVAKWAAFQVNQSIKAAQGREVTTTVKLTQERGEFNSKKFGFFTFSRV